MKTIFENRINYIQMKNIFIHFLFKKQVVYLLLILCSFSINAQDTTSDNSSVCILDKIAFIETLRVNDMSLNGTYSSYKNLVNLLYNIQPSVYINSGTVNSYGEKPKNLFTTISSLNSLNNPDILKNYIQIATIRIDNPNDLNLIIDLSVFGSFKNLKYIHIVSTVNTTAQQINTMIQNNNKMYNVFYTIEIGENN